MTILYKDVPALLISLAAFVVAALAAVSSTYFAYKSDKARVLFDVFTEFRSEKFTRVRTLIGETVVTGESMNFEPFREYSYFLNHIGQLLDKNYIGVDELYQMAGHSIIDAWRILGPKIMSVRTGPQKRRYSQFHFQYLAAQLMNYQQAGDKKIDSIIAKSETKINNYSRHY